MTPGLLLLFAEHREFSVPLLPNTRVLAFERATGQRSGSGW